MLLAGVGKRSRVEFGFEGYVNTGLRSFLGKKWGIARRRKISSGSRFLDREGKGRVARETFCVRASVLGRFLSRCRRSLGVMLLFAGALVGFFSSVGQVVESASLRENVGVRTLVNWGYVVSGSARNSRSRRVDCEEGFFLLLGRGL